MFQSVPKCHKIHCLPLAHIVVVKSIQSLVDNHNNNSSSVKGINFREKTQWYIFTEYSIGNSKCLRVRLATAHLGAQFMWQVNDRIFLNFPGNVFRNRIRLLKLIISTAIQMFLTRLAGLISKKFDYSVRLNVHIDNTLVPVPIYVCLACCIFLCICETSVYV